MEFSPVLGDLNINFRPLWRNFHHVVFGWWFSISIDQSGTFFFFFWIQHRFSDHFGGSHNEMKRNFVRLKFTCRKMQMAALDGQQFGAWWRCIQQTKYSNISGRTEDEERLNSVKSFTLELGAFLNSHQKIYIIVPIHDATVSWWSAILFTFTCNETIIRTVNNRFTQSSSAR